MSRYRNGLIYLALLLIFGGAWIAFCAWRLLAWWLITIGSLVVSAIAQAGELALTGRLHLHRRPRRRAHARSHTTSRKALR